MLQIFLEIAKDHYWDSLEPQKELILDHLASIWSVAEKELQQPANTVEVKASQVLSRDERDALISVYAYLTMLQSDLDEGSFVFYRIQDIIKVIYRLSHDQ